MDLGGKTRLKEAGGYRVGQYGPIDVLDSGGRRRFEVRGEIVRLIPTSDPAVYALVETARGTGLYRVW